MTYGGRRTHLDDRSLSRILRIVRAFAEGALVAIGFAVAILAIGIPVALVARAAGAVGLWLAGDGIAAFARAIELAAPVGGILGAAAAVAGSLVLFFSWRRAFADGPVTSFAPGCLRGPSASTPSGPPGRSRP